MNDMIKGTAYKDVLRSFQEACRLGTKFFKYGRVTRGWWHGFKNRFSHRLVTKRGEKFACNRAERTTLKNIRQMYDVIYDELVDACVAFVLDCPVCTYVEGDKVTEDKWFGKK